MTLKIVLFQPKIPQNCGNIVRTCAVTGAELVLVKPLGFSTTSRHLKRAGLDYWEGVKVTEIENLDTFLENETAQPYFFSSHSSQSYHEIAYPEDAILIFGSETEGLPEYLHRDHKANFARIPMLSDRRCLNLATSVGIVVYEAWRQQGFTGALKGVS